MKQLICIGKNYLEHAKELGDSVPEQPVIFLKPSHVAEQVSNQKIQLPLDDRHGPVHFECEFVFKIKNPLGQDYHSAFDEITLGMDLTKRDLQQNLKKSGHPWEISKVFYFSAILGPWIPLSQFKSVPELQMEFFLNENLRQKAQVKDMRFSPLACLQAAREHFPVFAGDVIFTGTPAGVGELKVGDQAKLYLNHQPLYQIHWNQGYLPKDL